MATIQSAIRLNDMMSAPVRNITNALNMMLSSWESLESSTASGLNADGIESIRSELNQATIALDRMGDEQEEFNRKVNSGSDAMDGLTGKILGAVGAFAGMQGIQKLVNLSDTYTQTQARLAMVVDEASNVEELNDKIFASAQRARAGYQGMADAVAKLSLNAGDAFTNNDETILFAENLNKLFAIAGTEQQSIESATLQLTQALGSGVLRGEEFNAVFEAAPNIMQTVADYMGVPIGKLRGMAQEGQITADIVKNALLSATGDINAQFESMPMTWGQVWTGIMNGLYHASIPLLKVISTLAQNWSILQPIALGVAGALAVYLVVTKGVELATKGWAKAQAFLNSVMAMNPVVIIIMAVILLISLIYAVVAAINKAKGTSISATGVIAGVFTTLFSYLWNIIAAFVNFFANVWTDPIGAIVRLFADLADNVLGILELIAKGIDKVFGSNLADTVSGWRSGLSGLVEEKYGTGIEVMPKMDAVDAFNSGYEWGEGVEEKVGGLFGANLEGAYDLEALEQNVGEIGDYTGAISDSLDITNENLKYLRDVAEQEVINRFTTAEIRVEMGGVNNTVNQNVDLDGVMDYMVTGVQEAMERVAEGVHN